MAFCYDDFYLVWYKTILGNMLINSSIIVSKYFLYLLTQKKNSSLVEAAKKICGSVFQNSWFGKNLITNAVHRDKFSRMT